MPDSDVRVRPGRDRQLEVVLIEDHDDVREVLSVGLTMEGFRVRGCATVDGGIEEILKKAPDALLVDIHLPDGTGDHLARVVRADRAAAELLIVAITGDALAAQTLEGTFDACLLKPVTAPVIAALVRRELEKRRRERRTSPATGFEKARTPLPPKTRGGR